MTKPNKTKIINNLNSLINIGIVLLVLLGIAVCFNVIGNNKYSIGLIVFIFTFLSLFNVFVTIVSNEASIKGINFTKQDKPILYYMILSLYIALSMFGMIAFFTNIIK